MRPAFVHLCWCDAAEWLQKRCFTSSYNAKCKFLIRPENSLWTPTSHKAILTAALWRHPLPSKKDLKSSFLILTVYLLDSGTRKLQILRVSDLQFCVCHVVRVRKLHKVAADVWVRDFARLCVMLQVLCQKKNGKNYCSYEEIAGIWCYSPSFSIQGTLEENIRTPEITCPVMA